MADYGLQHGVREAKGAGDRCRMRWQACNAARKPASREVRWRARFLSVVPGRAARNV